MKKLLLGSAALALFSISIIFFQISCKKDANAQTSASDNSQSETKICDVRGVYTGKSTSVTGAASHTTYELRDNNFAVGSGSLGSEPVTFGGYRNTCDSVVMSVYYNAGHSYYLLQGKLKNHDSTISGTFYNLTTVSDSGTFVLKKQ